MPDGGSGIERAVSTEDVGEPLAVQSFGLRFGAALAQVLDVCALMR